MQTQPMNKYLEKIASFKEMSSKATQMAAKPAARPASKLSLGLTAGIGGAALIGTGFWQKHMQQQQEQEQGQDPGPTDRPQQGLTGS